MPKPATPFPAPLCSSKNPAWEPFRISRARAEDNRPLFYKKDISLLARNGFDFETSKRIMDIDQADYLKIIKLL